MRRFTGVPFYVLHFLILLVFTAPHVRMAKRWLFVVSVLSALYEFGLYQETITETDFLVKHVWAKHLCLFEIVRYFHFIYAFIFVALQGAEFMIVQQKSFTEKEKITMLQRLSEKQEKIGRLLQEKTEE